MNSHEATAIMSRQKTLDISGTILSFLCIAHCVLLPLMVSLLPTIPLKSLQNAYVHFGLLLMVIPVVAFAVHRGYRHHDRIQVPVLASIGVVALLVGGIWGHALHLEAHLTIIGSAFLVTTHLLNARYCKIACEVPAKSA
jgi:uncharacterized membrane protein